VNEEHDTVTITIPDFSPEDVEVEFEESLKATSRKIEKGSSRLQEKVEKLSREFEDFVADEMEEFFDEFRARMKSAKAE
jgi:cerevisin